VAIHKPIGHQSKQHTGKYEDQSKLEHNRIATGPSKDAKEGSLKGLVKRVAAMTPDQQPLSSV
jgi:hypothetical protein